MNIYKKYGIDKSESTFFKKELMKAKEVCETVHEGTLINDFVHDRYEFNYTRKEAIFIDYWKNEVERLHLHLKDGLVECKMRDEDGSLNKHFYLKNGKFEGEYLGWYFNNVMYKKCSYKDGKLHGKFKEWNLDGSLSIKATYGI